MGQMSFSFLFSPQERQRLETILNLCAEYNRGGTSGLEPLSSGRIGFPGVLTDGLGQMPSVNSVLGGMPSSGALHLLQKQRESDEENLKEECSSTESTHQEVRTSPAPSTPSALHNGDRQVRCLVPTPHPRMLSWNQCVLGFSIFPIFRVMKTDTSSTTSSCF